LLHSNEFEPAQLRLALATNLNRIILGPSIYDQLTPARLKNLDPTNVKHWTTNLTGSKLAYQNREILDAAFTTNVLAHSHPLQFPVLVVQSRNDHLNSFLYPVANTVFNGEATAFYENAGPKISELVENQYNHPAASFSDLITGTLRLPYTVLDSAAGLLVNYPKGLYYEAKNRHWRMLPDTLAQLPLVEIPVQTFSPTNYYTGDYGSRKGFFNLGPAYESAARMSVERATNWNDLLLPPPYSTNASTNYNFNANLVYHTGVTFVDASSVVSEGIYSLDYSHATIGSTISDYTIGWLDPVGAHGDYMPHTPANNGVFDFIYFGLGVAKELKMK
jgi:hypothetical protein